MLLPVVARNFYDVIVIGTQLGPLLTAALLARRGFRVLLIAHDDLPWTYSLDEYRFQQEPFMFSGADSPAVRRVLSELSLTQDFRRRTAPHDPYFQVVLPRHRIDFTGNAVAFGRELEREFHDVRRPIEAFYTVAERCNQELDKLVGTEKLTLPPETFFERRELASAAVHNPFSRARGPVTLFGDMPPSHPFRLAVMGQVRWASDLDLAEPSSLQVVRLHASWTRGTLAIDGGLEGLKGLVLDRIARHSGDVRHDLSADRILTRRGRVAGVRMTGQEEITGCTFVVLGADAHHIPRLIDEKDLGRAFVARLAQVRPTAVRYTLNLVVESRVMPEGMARNLIYISDPAAPLMEENLLRIEASGVPSGELRTLCIGALLPVGKAQDRSYLEGMRGRILARVRWLVPFLDQHLVAVDSPYDGLPVQDRRRGREVALGDKWIRSPSRMPTIFRVDPPGPLDVTGLHHRTGLKNLVLACRQVVPGLGIEGEFLTALGAARIITKSDRRKRRFGREAWTKIDL
jgi:phytoene dehydrogenase-like protein